MGEVYLHDEDEIMAMAVSPDGRLLLTAARADEHSSSELRVWRDPDCDGWLCRSHKTPSAIAGVAFSADGETYAAASECYITVFQTVTGRRVRSIKVLATGGCAEAPLVSSFAWSPDDSLFAVGSGGPSVDVYVSATRGILERLGSGDRDDDQWGVLSCGRRICTQRSWVCNHAKEAPLHRRVEPPICCS